MKLFNRILNIYKYLILSLVTILMLFLALIFFLELSQLFDIVDIIDKNTLEIANENIKFLGNNTDGVCNKPTNRCIFAIFSHLFDKSNNSYKCYPSKFIKNDITYKYNNLYLPDEVEEYIKSSEQLRDDLIAIATECSSILKYYKT